MDTVDPRQIKRIHLIILTIILLAGLFLRTYRLDTLPDGFFCDEASLGYNAWSILHYGIDEMGREMPLYAKSLGVHKNPIFVYSSMIPIAVFGLSEWSVRLTSSVYGWLTILAVFWLLLEIHGTVAALIGAAFLAILPWNFHFSRIAFELITWPCLFTSGVAALLHGCRKRPWVLLLGGLLLGLALHSYVMAVTFIPLFLPIFGLIYFKPLLKHYPWVLGAVLIFILLTIPAVHHHMKTQQTLHFQTVNWWANSTDQPLPQRLQKLWSHYHPYFSQEFLVISGDNNPRHSLANHGPIYSSLFYLATGGLILGLLPPKRHYWILVAWTALYPLGAALTIDRYVTRSIIGSPLAPIWGALAIAGICHWIGKIKWRWIRISIHTLIFMTVTGLVSPQAFAYFKRYHDTYNLQSACGIYGFQYGYKELMAFMEPLRDTYPQMLWTAHNVNEPYIFALFYNQIPTDQYVKDHKIGYRIVRSFDYSKYDLSTPTLFAVRTDELMYFDDYTVEFELIGFDQTPQFTVIAPRSRRSYIDHWSFLGPFRKKHPETCSDEYPDPIGTFSTPQETLSGETYWQAVILKPPLVDIQGLFIDADPDHPRNPEFVEAIGASWMYLDEPVSGFVELTGSRDTLAMWLNGELIHPQQQLDTQSVVRFPFTARAGWNEWSIRACEGVGDWFFIMTLVDKTGNRIIPALSRVTPPGFDDHPLTADRKLIDGYGGVP